MNGRFFAAAAVAALFTMAGVPASGAIIQQVFARATPPMGLQPPGIYVVTSATDTDSVVSDADGSVSKEILAELSESNGGRPVFELLAGAGRFGQVGLSGFTEAPGRFETSVGVLNTGIVNTSSREARATARFIIDGGFLELVAAPGSSISFELSLETGIFNSATQALVGGSRVFHTFAEITADQAGAVSLTTQGEDIGIDFEAFFQNGRADIPLGAYSADLGTIGPNDVIALAYNAFIVANATPGSEGVVFEFSDPLSVDQVPSTPITRLEVDLVPAAAVPLPATAPLLFGALGLLGLHRSRRRG